MIQGKNSPIVLFFEFIFNYLNYFVLKTGSYVFLTKFTSSSREQSLSQSSF